MGQPGAQEARDYLGALVRNRVVYLDVDDLHVTDVYDRLVGVVYVRFNSTYFLNVNKALLSACLAEVADFPNEFDPAVWTLYVEPSAEVGPWAEASAAMWMAGIAVIGTVTLGVVIVSHRFRRGSRR